MSDTRVSLIVLGPVAFKLADKKSLQKPSMKWRVEKSLKNQAEFFNSAGELVAAYTVRRDGYKPMDLRRYKQKS